jgi:hypothetical protein
MMVEFWEKEEWSLYDAEAATEMQICQAETKRLLKARQLAQCTPRRGGLTCID